MKNIIIVSAIGLASTLFMASKLPGEGSGEGTSFFIEAAKYISKVKDA